MSLHIRLVLVIGLIVAASLALGGGLAWLHATRSVRTEMSAALTVGEHIAHNAIARFGTAPPGNQLSDLIAVFNDERHVRAALVSVDGRTIATSSIQLPRQGVPAWFSSLFEGNALQARIPLPPPDTETIVLTTDPRNEIGEVWTEFSDNLLAISAFGALTLALVTWSLGRALRPLGLLSRAFIDVGAGNYAARAAEHGSPELVRLAAGFNAMVGRLAAAEAKGRALNEQIVTIQEEERAELARDLHDDVGPYLFAANVDAAQISRLAATDGNREIGALVGGVQDSIAHMQSAVRSILERLRPAGLADIGLAPGLLALVEFWRSRHPSIAIGLDIDGGQGFGANIDAVIYRIVQESLSNAIRHGKPRSISIAVGADRAGAVKVMIADDGRGLREPADRSGFGILGMSERVASIGGKLAVANRADGSGVTVAVYLPVHPQLEAARA